MAEETATPVIEAPPQAMPEVRPELQNLLDKKLASRSPQKKAPSTTATPETSPTTPEKKTPEATPEAPSIPSFLRESIEPAAEPEKPQTPSAPDVLPEDFGEAETDPKKKEDMRKFRTEYNKKGDEIKRLQTELAQSRDAGQKPNAETEAKLKELQDQNAAMSARLGVESHPDFQRLLALRKNIVGYAAKTLKDLGVDPTGLNKVLSSTGKARYEAIDDLSHGLPQAARDDISNALREIQGLDGQIIGARSNYKTTWEQLQKTDLEAGQKALEAEKQSWGKTFDTLWSAMRDKSGVEVFRKSDDPKDADWNARVDAMQENARRIVLDNDDPAKLIAAVQLGHAADMYRGLFHSTRTALQAALKKIAAYERATPTITPEIGGERESAPEIKPGERGGKTLGRLGMEFLHKQRNSG